MDVEIQKISQYEKNYTEKSLFAKVVNNVFKLANKVLEKVFILYYTAKDVDTPMWAKSMIYGALGYFILPLDLIPDVVPVIGFSDDLTAMVAVLGAVALFVKDEHIVMSKEKVSKLLSKE